MNIKSTVLRDAKIYQTTFYSYLSTHIRILILWLNAINYKWKVVTRIINHKSLNHYVCFESGLWDEMLVFVVWWGVCGWYVCVCVCVRVCVCRKCLSLEDERQCPVPLHPWAACWPNLLRHTSQNNVCVKNFTAFFSVIGSNIDMYRNIHLTARITVQYAKLWAKSRCLLAAFAGGSV